MYPAIIIVSLIAFMIIDVILRFTLKKMEESKVKKERQEALDIGLRLEFAEEAKSLKRVEVENPRAKILAVDDEAIILDSFRKILVLAGYSIDTVQAGQEALTLLKKHNYDFVFTDLKMPEMDGVEVVKAVKHLRPDIDVIVITGFATIETAVETMKYGAMDYVQKPFTDDELTDFVNKTLIRRNDRLEREMRPAVNLITSSAKTPARSEQDFNIPAGVFISTGHTWGSIELNGLVRIGIDDFAQKLIGKIDGLDFPKEGQTVKKGDVLFTIKRNSHTASFKSPVSGTIKHINNHLYDNIDLITKRPYEHGWICYIEANNLNSELAGLKIGVDAASWYQEEIERYTEMSKGIEKSKSGSSLSEEEKHIYYHQMDDNVWDAFTKTFLDKV